MKAIVMLLCVMCGEDWFGRTGQFAPARCARCGSRYLKHYGLADIRCLQRQAEPQVYSGEAA